MNTLKDSLGFEPVVDTSDANNSKNETGKGIELFYYTNYESFLKIMSGKRIKFNRIDRIDGTKEMKYFEDDLYKSIFVSSFTTDSEKLPMWSMYTEGENGIRLGFQITESPFFHFFQDKERNVIGKLVNGEMEDIRLWGSKSVVDSPIKDWFVELTQKDIIYDEKELMKNPIRLGQIYNLIQTAAVKQKVWGFENETRILAYLRSEKDNIVAPEFEYLLVPIRVSQSVHLSVTFSPWMEDTMKEIVKESVKKYIPKCEVEFFDSSLKKPKHEHRI